MERKKIIAVAVLAVGIVAWRMDAMKRAAGEMGPVVENAPKKYASDKQEKAVPANMIRVTLGDGKVLDVPLNKARLFHCFDAMFSWRFKEQETRAVNLPEISSDLFNALLSDLDWVEQVRAQQQANETEQQAARRIAKTMPAVPFDRNSYKEELESLATLLKSVDFLQQRGLIELYSRQVADMIKADESMRLLVEGNGEYYALITSLFSNFKNNIMEYMPRAAIPVGEYTFGQNTAVISVAISADGNRVVMVSSDRTATIMAWDGSAWVEQYAIAHNNRVRSVAISADGNKVVTGSWDNRAKIVVWNGSAWIEQYTIAHNKAILSVAISADGNRVVTGSEGRTAKIVAWDGNAWIEQYTIRHRWAVVSVAISADGNKVVTGSEDNTVKVIGWKGNKWLEQYDSDLNDAEVLSVAISADGSTIVTGAEDGRIMILKWDTGDLEPTTATWNAWEWGKQWHAKDPSAPVGDIYWSVRSVAISANGNKVVNGSCYHSNSISVWNGSGWIEQYSSPNTEHPVVAISADGNRVVMESKHPNYAAKIVGSNNDVWVDQYYIRHNGDIASVAISADGNRVVTGSADNTAKIVMFLSTSLPGISDFDAWLFVGLLGWAKNNEQKISKVGWVGDILRSIRWSEVEPGAKKELQKLIRETMQHAVMQ